MKKLLPFLFLAMTSICRADSKTPRLGLTIPTIGSPTWGQKVNGNFQILDATAIAGSIGLLAVGTGTANNFTTTVTSITYGISFLGSQFLVATDTNNRTAYVTFTGTATGGGGGGSGSAGATAFGSLVTSSANVSQFNISTTPVKLAAFLSTGPFSNTIPSTTSSQIQVSTAGTYWVGMYLFSTGTGTPQFYLEIRDNGNSFSPKITCNDFPSVRCDAFGGVNLSSGDIISVYVNTNSLAQSTITVQDAGLVINTIGGPGATGATGPQGPAGSGGGTATLPLPPGDTNYIQNRNSLQSGTTAFPDFIRIGTRLTLPTKGTISTLADGGGNIFIQDDYANSNLTIQQNALFAGGSNDTTVGETAGQNLIGSNDTYVGVAAGSNDAGSRNSGFGVGSGFGNSGGTDNVFFGYYAGSSNTNGIQNTLINTSENAGGFNQTGNRDTFVGFNSEASGSAQSNRLGLGYNAKPACDDCGVIGDPTDPLFFLGIGTNTPRAPLDVYGGLISRSTFTVSGGTVSINGTVYNWKAGLGGAGQFLQNNNGVIASAAPSGGAGSISTITAGGNIAVANSTGPNVTVSLSTTIAGPVTFSSTTIGLFNAIFYAAQAKLPGSNGLNNVPFISNSTGEAAAGVYFDDTSTQNVTWPALCIQYDGRPLYAQIVFTSTATSGTIDFGVSIATQVVNVTTTNFDTLTYNVEVTTSVVSSANSNALQNATVSLSTQGLVNGQPYFLQLRRLAGLLDTAVGFARVKWVWLYE